MKKSFFAEYRIIISKILCIPVIVIAFVCTPKVMYFQTFNAILEFLGFTLATIGVLGRIFSSLFMGNNRNKNIVTEGIYSITRNPLYFFSFTAGLGITITYGSIIFLILFIAFFSFYYYLVIKSEENHLSKVFKEDYTHYKKSSPRFFPNFSLFKTQSEYITTSYKCVLKTSIDSSLILILSIIIVIIKHLNPLKFYFIIW